MQLQVETQIYKKDAIKDGINDAGTKANHYITLLEDEFGIRVHGKYNFDDPNAQPYSSFVQINSDDISMWRKNQKMMSLNDSTLIFYDGTGTANSDKLAEFGSTIKIYNPTKGTAAVTISSTGATFTGNVNATSLSTGTKTASTTGKGTYIASDGAIYSGTGNSNYFQVSNTGVLTATEADIGGKITATSGIIGGWNIGTDSSKSLYYGNQTPGATDSNLVLSTSSVTNSNAIGGSATGLHWFMSAGKVFGVTTSGALYSTSGHIGGWTIDANNLKSSNGTVGLRGSGSGDTDVVFWAGNATPGSAPFRVTRAGGVTATNLSLQASQINGLSTVATTGDYDDLSNKPTIPSLTNYIYKDGRIGSVPADGATGFVVSSAGALTASNVIIYGSIYASKGYIGGWQIGTDGNKTLHNGAANTSPVPGSGVIVISKGIAGKTTADGVLPASKTWTITAGNKFGITTDGTMYATGAVISGALTATSLTINGANYATDITTISSKATPQDVKTAKEAAISTAADDATGKANEAATKATNYITISGDGILVRRSTSDNTNGVKINSDGVRIYRNSTYYTYISANGMDVYAGDANNSVAFFGNTARIGKEDSGNIEISDSSITATSENGEYFNINGNGSSLTTTAYATTTNYGGTGTITVDLTTSGAFSNQWSSISNGGTFRIKIVFGFRTTAGNGSFYSTQKTVVTTFTKGTANTSTSYVTYNGTNSIIFTSNHPSGSGTYIGRQRVALGKVTTTPTPFYRFGHDVAESGGAYGFLVGEGTQANSNYQFVCGRYNSDNSNAYFIVGTGTSDTNRSNTLSVSPAGLNITGDIIETNGGYSITSSGHITIQGHSTPIGSVISKTLSSAISLATSTSTTLLSMTIPAGAWVIIGQATFASNATGIRRIVISPNSADATIEALNEYAGMQVSAASAGQSSINVSYILNTNLDSTYYLCGIHTRGSALDVVSAWFKAIRIA